MTLAHLLVFNLTLLAAIASPGPSLLFLTRTTLAEGRAAGIAAGLGLGLVAAGWTAAALTGLDAALRLLPGLYLTLKTAGAAYLLWIAWTTWAHAREPVAAPAASTARRAFRRGMLVNLANPKSVLFAGAVLVVIFPAGLSAGEKAVIALNHLLVEWTVLPALALVLSIAAVRRAYFGAKVWFDRAAAAVLGGLGLSLLAGR